MNIIVNGVSYADFTTSAVSRSLDNIADDFSFEFTSSNGVIIPFTGGESCVINVDGEKVLTGVIEVITISGSDTSHVLSASGRDKTRNIVDSKLFGVGQIAPPIKFKTLIDIALASVKLDIEVIDRVGVKGFEKVEDMPTSEPGMNAYQFIEKLARKRQVLLSSNADGNLEITRSIGRKIDAFVNHKINGRGNNVLNYDYTNDRSGRFRDYIITGQASMNAVDGSLGMSSDAKTDQTGRAQDVEIEQGRQQVISGEAPTSVEEANLRATWQANFDKSKSLSYSCDVDGWRNQTGELWEPNTIINVRSDYAGIDSPMLVNKVTYTLAQGTGRVTSLELLPENAYTLELSEPVTSKTNSATKALPLPEITS